MRRMGARIWKLFGAHMVETMRGGGHVCENDRRGVTSVEII